MKHRHFVRNSAEMTEKEWIMAYRVIHYINQFFAGIGGEDK